MTSIALLMPVYNCEQFLPELLLQATQQAFAEVIFYDDCSTDNSAAIIAACPGVRLIRGDRRRGPAYARNALLDACSAQHVHFHDADDPLNLALGQSARVLGPNEAAIFPFEVRKDGVDTLHSFSRSELESDPIAFFLNNFVQLNALVFPAKTLKAIGGFFSYLHFCEDRDIQVRAANTDIQFRYIEDAIPRSITRNGSLTSEKNDILQLRHALWFLHRCFKTLPKRYHQTLGFRAMEYAWHFYYRGDCRSMRYAIYLSRRCGVKTHPRLEGGKKFIARVAGTEALFRFEILSARMITSIERPMILIEKVFWPWALGAFLQVVAVRIPSLYEAISLFIYEKAFMAEWIRVVESINP